MSSLFCGCCFSFSEYLWLYLAGLLFNRLNPHKSKCRNKEGTFFLFGSSVTQNTFPGEKVNLNSFIRIPAEQFSGHVASIKGSSFLSWSKVGGRRGCTERGCTARSSKAGQGFERDFLLQVPSPWESGCRSGEVSLPGCPWVPCPAQIPSEGNPELCWHCLQGALGKTTSGSLWRPSHLSLFFLLWSTQFFISIFLLCTLVST